MRKRLLCFIVIGFCLTAHAQTNRIKVMLQQIAANAALIKDIEKGYEMARAGLDFISAAKNGEFKLHSLFFKSLSDINPKIAGWVKIADIIAMQVALAKNYKKHFEQIKSSGAFTSAEINYCFNAFTKCIDASDINLNELATLLTADNYQLTDDERMKRIDAIFIAMQSDYRFEQHFGNEALILANQRKQEQTEINTSRQLNGPK